MELICSYQSLHPTGSSPSS